MGVVLGLLEAVEFDAVVLETESTLPQCPVQPRDAVTVLHQVLQAERWEPSVHPAQSHPGLAGWFRLRVRQSDDLPGLRHPREADETIESVVQLVRLHLRRTSEGVCVGECIRPLEPPSEVQQRPRW
ncbi:MAG: hypothetical protein ACTHQ3_07190 [Motilibacteraceae bacterium]